MISEWISLKSLVSCSRTQWNDKAFQSNFGKQNSTAWPLCHVQFVFNYPFEFAGNCWRKTSAIIKYDLIKNSLKYGSPKILSSFYALFITQAIQAIQAIFIP